MFSCQAFQRQVHERLTQLELVNKQYRRLARENRTDAASKLKVMVHEGNQRWDSLQKRVAAVLRRLKVRGGGGVKGQGSRADWVVLYLNSSKRVFKTLNHTHAANNIMKDI